MFRVSIGFYIFLSINLGLCVGVLCFWGAQFIEIGFNFAPLIFNHAAELHPAKLEPSGWS